ncbi:uncharacterized protein LOC134835118 [Culicoides brevitarsis]|uniref:uncharacterized protein LOC134835118 n=1 Tax=Culicoides brevitarsis TaxID=469753 RepID=UPI00307B8FE0
MDFKLRTIFCVIAVLLWINSVQGAPAPLPSNGIPIDLNLAQDLLSDSVKRVIAIFQNPMELTARMQKLGQLLFEHEVTNIRDIIGVLVEEYDPDGKRPNVNVDLANMGNGEIGSNESNE